MTSNHLLMILLVSSTIACTGAYQDPDVGTFGVDGGIVRLDAFVLVDAGTDVPMTPEPEPPEPAGPRPLAPYAGAHVFRQDGPVRLMFEDDEPGPFEVALVPGCQRPAECDVDSATTRVRTDETTFAVPPDSPAGRVTWFVRRCSPSGECGTWSASYFDLDRPRNDIDGDGLPDLVGTNPGSPESGSMYVVLSRDPTQTHTILPPSGVRASGIALGADDIDGDGHADVVVGAQSATEGRGGIVIYWGSESGLSEGTVLARETIDGEAPDITVFDVLPLGLGRADNIDICDRDGDGVREIVVSDSGFRWDVEVGHDHFGGGLTVFRLGPDGWNPSERFHSEPFDERYTHLGIDVMGRADLNRDGRVDIVAVNRDPEVPLMAFLGTLEDGPQPFGDDWEEQSESCRFFPCGSWALKLRPTYDIDGDGYQDELAVGTPLAPSGATRAGVVDLFYLEGRLQTLEPASEDINANTFDIFSGSLNFGHSATRVNLGEARGLAVGTMHQRLILTTAISREREHVVANDEGNMASTGSFGATVVHHGWYEGDEKLLVTGAANVHVVDVATGQIDATVTLPAPAFALASAR